MTITIAWVRQSPGSSEFVVASDSRLRSEGAIDQCQKIFLPTRGDCCLGFCGDSGIAYPLFIQVGTALNNHITTRTRAEDVSHVQDLVGKILNALVISWDLPKARKAENLRDTKILFGGWSWINSKFIAGAFRFEEGRFVFHRQRTRLPHPWKEVPRASLLFLGDYEKEYMAQLSDLLNVPVSFTSAPKSKIQVNLDYTPVQALQALLESAQSKSLHLIGGMSQMAKIYQYGNNLPFVVGTKEAGFHLLGRKLMKWEKTEYPILDLSNRQAHVRYPMAIITSPNA